MAGGAPESMDAILAHPFFCDPLKELDISAMPISRGMLHVMISYQSTQLVLMMRVRHFLRGIGVNTADGTEVPPGEDWR